MSRKRSKYYPQAKPIASMLAGILKPAVRKRGLARADLVMAWRDIAGPQFGECTMPDRIIWPKSSSFDERNGPIPGTLVVKCAGPVAILLQHEVPLIAERVNTFLGWYAIERIKIVQGPVQLPDRKATFALPEVSADKQAEVRDQVSGIQNDGLRNALATLGTSVAARALVGRKSR